jgi:type VII secretion ATPase EccA
MSDEILNLFSAGFAELITNNNPGAAKLNFDYGISLAQQRGMPQQADFHRALAACQPGWRATAENVRNIYAHRESYGMLSTAAGWPMAQPALRFTASFFDADLKLTTVADLHAAASLLESADGRYAEAKAIIDEAPESNQLTDFALAVLYYQSGRWPDALAPADKFRLAARLNENDRALVKDGQTVPDIALQSLSHLIAGTAQAHLGNIGAAKALLLPVAQGSTAKDHTHIASEANRILGLAERNEGHEEAAQKFFAAAQSYFDTPEARKAKENPHERMAVTSAKMIDQRSSYWDVRTEPSLEKIKKEQYADAQASLLAKADAELERQIGMESVKEQVRGLRAGIAFAQEARRRGKTIPGRTNHLIFQGPPGTGKTTIARIVAMIYAGLGVTRTDVIVETGRADFIGTFEGHSAEKTDGVIAKSLGGILFIDEAYDLIQDRDGRPDPFGQEAVNRLLTAMENNRNDLIVILAGYKKDLDRFLDTNEGLRSRFSKVLDFETYTPSQLADIARVVADSRASILADEAHARIKELLSAKVAASGANFIDRAGNGRFSRNIIETAERRREIRLASVDMSALTDDELMTLTAPDIDAALDSIINQLG